MSRLLHGVSPLIRSAFFVIATSLVARAAPAQAGSTASSGGEPTLSVPTLVEDFDVLRRALDEAHGGFGRFSPRAEVHRRLDRHRARLDRAMPVTAFAGILSEAIAELRDGHARLELDSLTAARLASARVFPLRVALEGERLVVQWNDAPGDTLLRPGMEIRRIDGRPVREIVGALLPKISGDGFVETGRRARLARDFPALHWLYVDPRDRFTIEATDGAGRRVTATLAGVVERERRATPNPVNERFSANLARIDGPPGLVAVEFLPGDVARLRIRAFDGAAFPATLDSAFRAIRERGIERLVLDLRGNGGGDDMYGALLVSHFMPRPFRYFDHIRVTTIAPSFATWPARTFTAMRDGTTPASDGGFLVTAARHPGVAEQQPAANPFRGRLVVLVDGRTFSTATDVAAQLRSSGRAVFVGEETAGTYEGNTSGLNALIVLPNSRLRMRVMMYGYWNAVKPAAAPGRGVVPEHELPLRVVDVLRGVDPAMERAAALLR